MFEIDKVMKKEMKTQFLEEYMRRIKLIVKSKLNGKNEISVLNTWSVSVLRYVAGIKKWTLVLGWENKKDIDYEWTFSQPKWH